MEHEGLRGNFLSLLQDVFYITVIQVARVIVHRDYPIHWPLMGEKDGQDVDTVAQDDVRLILKRCARALLLDTEALGGEFLKDYLAIQTCSDNGAGYKIVKRYLIDKLSLERDQIVVFHQLFLAKL